MNIPLTAHGMLAFALHAGLWLLAGASLGSLYFLSLRWTVRMVAGGRALPALALQVLRLALMAAALTTVVRSLGAVALLAATLGLLAARSAVLRREARP